MKPKLEKCLASTKMACRKIFLLVWKNFLFRKRSFCLTSCEIILPTLLIFLMLCMHLYFNGRDGNGDRDERREQHTHTEWKNVTEFPLLSESEILKKVECRDRDREGRLRCSIAYAPNNNAKINEIMEKFIVKLGGAFGSPEEQQDGDQSALDSVTQIQMHLPVILSESSSTNIQEQPRIACSLPIQTATVAQELIGFRNDEDIELYFTKEESEDNERWRGRKYKDDQKQKQGKVNPRVYGAIVFNEGLERSSNFPKNHKISYKIRITTSDSFYRWGISNTNHLFPEHQMNGADKENSESYAKSGFSGLQITLDKILTELLTSIATNHTINTQAFPYPAVVMKQGDQNYFLSLFPSFIVLGFLMIVPSIILNIVSEKKSGIKELMKMMGLPNWMHWFGWMLSSMMILMITVTIITILLFVSFSKAGPVITSESHWTLLWFALCLYAMACTSFCFFISALFQIPILATIVGIVLWITTYYAAWIPLDTVYHRLSIYEKMAAALLPNMAIHWLVRAINTLNLNGEGARWDNLTEQGDVFDSLTVGHMMLMLIVDTIVYIFLAIYFENVIPSEYGIRKPWYYIFKPLICLWRLREKIFKKRNTVVMPMPLSYVEDETPGFEAEEPNLTPGVIISNLRKSFGRNKVAVDNISLKMFNGQITILLGHNGAGKTTAMSMLTGLFAPTSGTAIINGYDINTQMDHVRDSLGLCPQHNLLFDKLTVAEHLIFFGRVKGLTFAQAKTEMIALLGQLRLTEKRNVLSKALSGGQKRKLSLGIALVGGTKVLILDEPTSGMDPEARRAIWDILLEMRGLRTILLTTHYMEEADVLGDRIAIMADGKIKCCGSPTFLKRFYGAGYTLRMTVDSSADKNIILSIVQNRIHAASWKSEKLSNPSEIAITLPSDAESTSLFPSMFADLTEKKEKVGICTLGLSLTTMDDVFIKVGELADEDDQVHHKIGIPIDSSRQNMFPVEIESPGLVKVKRQICACKGLYFQQFWAILVKRFIYTLRKRKLVIAQFVIPLLLIILDIYLITLILSADDPPPPLKMDLSHYKNAQTIYSYTNKDLADNYASLVGSGASSIRKDKNLVVSLLEIGNQNLKKYQTQYIVAADLNTSVVNAMFSTIPNHASPLSINLVSNAILRTIAADKKYSIDVTNHPLINEISSIQLLDGRSSGLIFGFLFCISLAVYAASFVVFPIEEKLSQAKQLQLMTGVSPFIFWTTSFVWDFFVMIILILLVLICFPIFEKYEAFTAYSGLGVIFLILIVYGYATIFFSYLCSLFLKTVAGGFAFVTMIHIITGLILTYIILPLESTLSSGSDQDGILFTIFKFIYLVFRFIGSIFPSFMVTRCMSNYIEISVGNSRCNVIPKKYIDLICETTGSKYDDLRICCPNCNSSNMYCFKRVPYLNWYKPPYEDGRGYRYTYRNIKDESNFRISGIGQDLLYLFLLGICCHCLLLLIEFGFIRNIVDRIFKSESFTFRLSEDADVKAESERAHFMIETGHVSDEALIVHDLCKSFGSFSAVSNLSFTVHHGECFGLLGVNGAGKTTAFRMLTGDEIRSSGNAFMDKYTLEKDRNKFLSNLGYCPQFDGIIGVLTGREMLELFGRLRGVPGKSVADEANKWLNKMGLYESGNVECMKYSGGMKRRLSAGMALVGDPGIILLDEPTSGVDPVSRRRFWKVLREVCESGVAVILTSHSMDECEALCSRLGIMVNGQFQCFGGVQHLKSKFVQGFSLLLKLKALISSESPELQFLQAEINEKFSPCILKDQHLNVLQYEVYKTPIPWAYVFQTMEDLKIRYVNTIEDFSVNETTLEQVFLSLAKVQYPPRVVDVSCMKKFCTCQCC